MRDSARQRALRLAPDPDAPFARGDGVFVSTLAFLESSALLADSLTSAEKILNLCEDRYQFLVAFAAAALRGSTTLLPSSHAASIIAETIAAFPGCNVLDDAKVTDHGFPSSSSRADAPTDFIAAIGHTSGSTGRPASHEKSWSGLCATTTLNAATIRGAISGDSRTQQPWIVATVPPQHMYGLETSVLLPLLAGFGIHRGRPLLPADIATALADVPAPRILVSTPIHLRSIVDSGVAFPSIAVVVSATAPLQRELAQQIEKSFGAVLVEMFGSTETCVIATRRTAFEDGWRPYPGISLEPAEGGTIVRAPWLARHQLLQDVIEVRADQSFVVIGRHGDLVEVAGKRASLSDLSRRLASLPGVRDAIVFQPPREGGGVRRCAALVVAPGLSSREVLGRFRPQVDAAFLPRPLVVIPELPRNQMGKLPMEDMAALLRGTRRG